MFTAETKIRVRYSETDQMGYVYYGNYAQYFEVGRTDTLREIGLSYKKLEESGIFLPVHEYYCKYLRPARYDEWLTVKTMIKEKPSVRLFFEYDLFNEKMEKISIAKTTLVFCDTKTGKPCVPPKYFMNKLSSFFVSS